MSEIWNAEEVARYLRLFKAGKPNARAVDQFAHRDPSFPRPYKLGPKTNRWNPEDIIAWVKSRPRSLNELNNGTQPKRGRKALMVIE